MAENATATPEAPVASPEVKKNSPDATNFARIWNASSSRKDALARFKAEGYDVSYSAMVARVKSYTSRGIKLKEIESAPRGRRLNVDEVNAEIAEQAGADAVAG